MSGIPVDLPVLDRSVVRLAVLDADGRVLLFPTQDPEYAGLTWWELPGGRLDHGRGTHRRTLRSMVLSRAGRF